jgi:hypothetical protein
LIATSFLLITTGQLGIMLRGKSMQPLFLLSLLGVKIFETILHSDLRTLQLNETRSDTSPTCFEVVSNKAAQEKRREDGDNND